MTNKNPLRQHPILKNVKFYADPALPLDEKEMVHRGSGNVFTDLGVSSPKNGRARAQQQRLKVRLNMTWHYIPVRYQCEDGVWVYTVQEFYGRQLHTVAKEGISAIGKNKKELIRDLEMMLHDLKKHSTKTIKAKDLE